MTASKPNIPRYALPCYRRPGINPRATLTRPMNGALNSNPKLEFLTFPASEYIMPYWQLFYHIVWATRYRAPILTPDIEPLIYDLLQVKAISLGGHVYALNGAYDHVHLIAAVPPKIALAKFIGQIKAVASTKYNQVHPYAPPFFWQKEYSIFSFAKNQLPFHVHYVERQKERHAEDNIIPILETIPSAQKPDLSGVDS